jgi:glyoxylase-like metal-dependent hydrolase (beta-lactamase superfamily II)
MKIFNLTAHSIVYTSNVFLVLGNRNAKNEVSTLIDVGNDLSIIPIIKNIDTRPGKKKIDQVILTHGHSDHTSILPVIKNEFSPIVFAFNTTQKGVDRKLNDGNFIKIGDSIFEIFHITIHSHDSICLYNDDEGILFSGDTNFPILIKNGEIDKKNLEILQRLNLKNIRTIFGGHGDIKYLNNRKFSLYTKIATQ